MNKRDLEVRVEYCTTAGLRVRVLDLTTFGWTVREGVHELAPARRNRGLRAEQFDHERLKWVPAVVEPWQIAGHWADHAARFEREHAERRLAEKRRAEADAKADKVLDRTRALIFYGNGVPDKIRAEWYWGSDNHEDWSKCKVSLTLDQLDALIRATRNVRIPKGAS